MAEISFVEVVDVGPGWNKVRASDGNVYTLKGNYNWRSNNPGNIEYGDFAKSMGAIGSGKPPAGRKRGFAIFPTYEAGTKAQEKLQFESPRYRDLSIKDAISRYAPEFENDSAAYAAQLAAAAGVTTDTKLSELTPQQRHAYLQAQHRVEGFVPGRISGEDGKPVPASVARQFAAIPLPPKDIPSAANDVGEGASFDMLARLGNPGGPADPSANIRVARTSDDIGIGTAMSQLDRFGQPGANPLVMSDELAYDSGRLQDIPIPPRRPVGPVANVPMPRARPRPPSPIADAANITPLTFPPKPPSPVAALSGGIVDAVRSPQLMGGGVGIPNEQIPGSDDTYSGANRMSTGGLGALLGRSVPPATPNPSTRSGTTITGRPDAPIGSMPARSAPDPAGHDQMLAARNPVPPPGVLKTAGGIAGTVQLPRDVRPNVPQIAPPPAVPQDTSFTQSPYYTPSYSGGGMPSVPKTIPQTVTAPNPAYRPPAPAAPMPAQQSNALAVQRAAATPTNFITAGQYTYVKGPNGYERVNSPTPATQSGGFATQRAAAPKSSSPYTPSDPRSKMVSKGTGAVGKHLGIGGW